MLGRLFIVQLLNEESLEMMDAIFRTTIYITLLMTATVKEEKMCAFAVLSPGAKHLKYSFFTFPEEL